MKIHYNADQISKFKLGAVVIRPIELSNVVPEEDYVYRHEYGPCHVVGFGVNSTNEVVIEVKPSNPNPLSKGANELFHPSNLELM